MTSSGNRYNEAESWLGAARTFSLLQHSAAQRASANEPEIQEIDWMVCDCEGGGAG